MMGADWASKNAVMTGPYAHGECTAGDRCSVFAVEDHWRATPNVAEIEVIQVPESQTQVAMLKSGEVDMAVVDYKLLADVVSGSDDLRFLETMPGGYVGQSIIFPGNLWEETHARTGEALNPWDSPAYDKDVAWIGDPWQEDSYHEGGTDSSVVRYTDTDNPAGMTDMEQARLVRLALSTALDRNGINDSLLNGIGTPIYSEYMGPEYPGWDPKRDTGVWDAAGTKTSATGGVIYELPDGDIEAAGALLDQAGYPADADGNRAIDGLVLQAYAAEAGPVGLEVADTVMSDWARLGIEISGLVEDYGGVISPRMKRREQYLPVLKNCDVHSNVWPEDWPIPPVDTSRTRPSWGCGFESKAGAESVANVLMEQDAEKRKAMHKDIVDYSMYWLQYAGVYQVPKGIVVNDRIKSWNAPQQHYANVSNNPELIVLND
jgi:ABC-type transport system substrate-binding protein